MRASDLGEMRDTKALAQKLDSEAVAWRDRRPARPKFSMEGVQVVRIPKRRLRSVPSTINANRP